MLVGGGRVLSEYSSARWYPYRKMATSTKVRGSPIQPWHAVSVVAGKGACRAAEELGDRRFLSAEAPFLPLPDCSSRSQCKCIYEHYPDRRATLRRETDRGRFPRPRLGTERRERHGRRVEDLDG